ncbi:DUF6894 family protein [Rhizobium sp. YIM 134829]|uniref:DUF6894 family protein n=1 Tax=Rhizobium sp. YIM 134829 TaxID=3390453 RepID=UPI0039792F27
MSRYYLHFHYSDTFFQDDEEEDFASLHDAEVDANVSIYDIAVSPLRHDTTEDLLIICITNTENEILTVLSSREVLAAPAAVMTYFQVGWRFPNRHFSTDS